MPFQTLTLNCPVLVGLLVFRPANLYQDHAY